MKKITNNKLQVTKIAFCVALRASSSLLGIARKRSLLTLLSSVLLSAFCLITNAQTDENRILDSATIQKNELKMTPELEEMVVTKLKKLPENVYSYYGIKNKAQLEHLQIGKPIPWYNIVNEELETVYTYNVFRMDDGEPLSLRFTDSWNVPVMSDGEPLLFGVIRFSDFGEAPSVDFGIKNTIEHFHNYEHKDLIIGSVGVHILNGGMDFLIIKKENKVLFVQVYDEATGEYFKYEYSFSELINPIKELDLCEKERQNRYYAKIADKSELILTPELTEMLLPEAYSYWSDIKDNDEYLSLFGIKNGAQLEHLQLGKPVPEYMIVNESLTFTGYWEVPVMSAGEPLFRTSVKLEDNGQYRWAGSGGATMVGAIHSYEHKGLIIGILKVTGRGKYLIIRKDSTDIFVKGHNSETGEVFIEYSLRDIINLFKK